MPPDPTGIRSIEEEGSPWVANAGNVGDREARGAIVVETIETLGTVNVLVNEAAVQVVAESLADILEDQPESTPFPRSDWRSRGRIHYPSYRPPDVLLDAGKRHPHEG